MADQVHSAVTKWRKTLDSKLYENDKMREKLAAEELKKVEKEEWTIKPVSYTHLRDHET